MTKNDLENLYTQAKQAFQARDFDRATNLLTQILVIDENYKDTSRLLARIVKEKRRHWYTDPRIWGSLLGLIMLTLLIWFVPKLPLNSFFAPTTLILSITPNAKPTKAATVPIPPTTTQTFSPTGNPLVWKRISMGQEFATDTVTSITVDSNDPEVIFVGMQNAGVFRSIDGGLSWSPRNQGLANTQVISLSIGQKNPNILYAGTLGGIFKTQDGGENWERIGEGRRLLMDYKNSSHLYISNGGNVLESSNEGITWQEHKNSCPKIDSWAINPLDGMTLYASDNGNDPSCKMGLYKSSDGARSWNLLGFEGQSILEIAVGSDDKGNELIYADTPGQGYQISNDTGISWKTLETTTSCGFLPVDSVSPDTIYCTNQFSDVMIYKAGRFMGALTISSPWNLHVNAFHADSSGGMSRMIAGGQGLFISTDNGQTWSNRSGGLGASRSELRIDPANNELMYLASYSGMEDQTCTLFRSKDSGKNWKLIMQGGHNSWCGPEFDSTNTIYLLNEGKLERSTNEGDTWTSSSLPSEAFFNWVSANPYLSGYLYAGSNELFYSTDNGSSWQKAINNSGAFNNSRFYYTKGGTLIYSVSAFSTDGGKAWNSCDLPEIYFPPSDSQLVFDPGDTSHLYLATGGDGILISTDGCQTWQSSNNGLGNLNVNSLSLDPNNPNTIYAGTNGGAYVSYDQGQTWEQINDGLLGVLTIYSIAIDSQNNIYASTPYGIFKLGTK
jgi:photosystem II stability/assembly factor-like uncharacterized protein